MNGNDNNTIAYYDTHGDEYFESTQNLDMSELYEPFLEMLPAKSNILDAGCGSGRDSLYFMHQGYNVTAFDASDKMVSLSSKLLGEKVMKLDFEDMDFHSQFNGIWACASLLHIQKNKMPTIMSKMAKALLPGGVIFASFKRGDGEAIKDERFFSYYSEKSMVNLLLTVPKLDIIRMWTTKSVREDRQNEFWLNVLARKA